MKLWGNNYSYQSLCNPSGGVFGRNFDPVSTPLGIYPEDTLARRQKDMCRRQFTADGVVTPL